MSTSLEGVTVVLVDAGPGELSIIGEPDRADLDVIASICDSETRPHLELRRESSTLHLSVGRADRGRRGFLLGTSTSMFVAVALPQWAKIEITQSYGPTSLRNVSAVNVRGGLGTLAISDVSGEVLARNGMGAMYVSRIGGNVDITDGAGQLLISNVGGSLRIAEDGAGQIAIDTVRGNVLIESDSGGEIRIDQILGDVLIEHDTSGAIVARDIGGAFTVEEKTSGGIVHERVAGVARIPSLKKRIERGPK